MIARGDFTDTYGRARKTGDEYLITPDMTTSHFVDINEAFCGTVPLTILKNNQYCVIENPVNALNGKPGNIKLKCYIMN